jgi:hypothetical protein
MAAELLHIEEGLRLDQLSLDFVQQRAEWRAALSTLADALAFDDVQAAAAVLAREVRSPPTFERMLGALEESDRGAVLPHEIALIIIAEAVPESQVAQRLLAARRANHSGALLHGPERLALAPASLCGGMKRRAEGVLRDLLLTAAREVSHFSEALRAELPAAAE